MKSGASETMAAVAAIRAIVAGLATGLGARLAARAAVTARQAKPSRRRGAATAAGFGRGQRLDEESGAARGPCMASLGSLLTPPRAELRRRSDILESIETTDSRHRERKRSDPGVASRGLSLLESAAAHRLDGFAALAMTGREAGALILPRRLSLILVARVADFEVDFSSVSAERRGRGAGRMREFFQAVALSSRPHPNPPPQAGEGVQDRRRAPRVGEPLGADFVPLEAPSAGRRVRGSAP